MPQEPNPDVLATPPQFVQADLEVALDVLTDAPAPALPSEAPKSAFSARPGDPRDSNLFGDSRAVLVAEMLGLLSSLEKSGLLWVTTARERFLLQLDHGRIVFAQSDRPPRGTRLGELLVRSGALHPDALAEVIEAARAAGQPLGAWLLATNRVASTQLHASLTSQVQQVFNRMFAAPDSTYQFEAGKRLAATDDVRLNVVQLLLESARSQDEAVDLPFPIAPARG
ncbi:MAG: DUF4388 domain-containing protein [Planctomycetes bacterium]|nr:DUF4388 domain-containing protein [Planctomycetota bacterium]